jgi:DNA (cytosine-5)-methyltransferase 1
MKPLLLDLFCGGGGACAGYERAGFEVIGVDNVPQPSYPGIFIQHDAMTFPLEGFDVIHASPPCQPYSSHVTSESSPWNDTLGKDEPALIPALRQKLLASGKPYVIENVASSPLEGITLCGSMFGLDIPRHRIFESNIFLLSPYHGDCRGIAKRAAERRGWDYRDMTVTGKGRRVGTGRRWAELLGIDWYMTQHQLKEAIPPAYTEWVGKQVMSALLVTA